MCASWVGRRSIGWVWKVVLGSLGAMLDNAPTEEVRDDLEADANY